MSMILGYIKEREISFLFFLLLVLLVIVLWNLYKKEKNMENIFDIIREEAGFQTACEIAKNLLKI